MKIKWKDTDFIPPIIKHIIEPMLKQNIKLSAFPNLNLYVGLVPDFEADIPKDSPWYPNLRRPHYTEHEGQHYCVVKDLWKNLLPVTSIMHTLAHEIGHYVHTVYLREDLIAWEQWAKEAHKKLDLVPRFEMGYPKVQSFEDFANGFAEVVNGRMNPYYAKLLRGKL